MSLGWLGNTLVSQELEAVVISVKTDSIMKQSYAGGRKWIDRSSANLLLGEFLY